MGADLEQIRDEARGLAASDEELLLLALFGALLFVLASARLRRLEERVEELLRGFERWETEAQRSPGGLQRLEAVLAQERQNLEDEMRPLPEAVAAVRAAVAAGDAEGVPFVVNARTDAFLRAGDRDPKEVLADAVERGRAFLDEGAACVFVPGRFDEPTVAALVEGIGDRRVSVIAVPGSLPTARLAELERNRGGQFVPTEIARH